MRRLGPLYGGAVALVHSTPVSWPAEVGDDARSPGWIVALGAPIGVAAWAAAALAHAAGIPAPIAAVIGLAILTLASAALVERGLADRIDGWHDKPRSTGSVVALVLMTVIRAACIAFVAPGSWLAVFVATAMLGRFAAIFLQALGDPIHDDEPRSLVATPAPAWLTGALGLATAVVAVLALGKAGVAALAIAAVAAFLLGVDAQRRDRGLSAPVVGAAAAVAELIFLLIASSH
jgi:cobalamin synthase